MKHDFGHRENLNRLYPQASHVILCYHSLKIRQISFKSDFIYLYSDLNFKYMLHK